MSTEKYTQALNILQFCHGEHGIWASPHRYKYQCWTRDLAFVLPSFVRFGGEQGVSLVQRHLRSLSERIDGSGKVPILFADDLWKLIEVKYRDALERNKSSFPMRRIIEEGGEQGLYNLTPGTKDSEIMYLHAMLEFAQLTGDYQLLNQYADQVFLAYGYVKEYLMRDGLVVGCDWRDTMEKELGDETLLTNNCLWYDVLSMISRLRYYSESDDFVNGVTHSRYRWFGPQCETEAVELKSLINERFFVDGAYQDRPNVQHVDPLGTSLAVLYNIVPPERYSAVVSALVQVNTSYGVTISCKHNPQTELEAVVIEDAN
jgi:hypothetical protein